MRSRLILTVTALAVLSACAPSPAVPETTPIPAAIPPFEAAIAPALVDELEALGLTAYAAERGVTVELVVSVGGSAAGHYLRQTRTVQVVDDLDDPLWVLAHELAHDLQDRAGVTGGNVERGADCIASVLTAGLPSPVPVTDCSGVDVGDAVLVLRGERPTDSSPPASWYWDQGLSPYASGLVRPGAHASLADLLAARIEAGWARSGDDLLLAEASAAATPGALRSVSMPASWWGPGARSVRDLRILTGADVLTLEDGTVLVDAWRARFLTPSAVADHTTLGAP